jgi:dienelactone hydrolase
VLPEAGTDYRKEESVDDATFETFRSIYEYEKTPLRSEVEFIDNEPEHWTIEKISFDAAYGRERMFVYFFIPRGVSPPYQTVVFFPGTEAISRRSSKDGRIFSYYTGVNFVVRSGRAVLFPVYKATFERGDGYNIYDPETVQSEHNAHVLLWWKDLSRSLDYLETRSDIDLERIAYYGGSMGAWLAPIFLAQDNRYRAAVLRLGGLAAWRFSPAFDTFNFVPRVIIPVLMLNGRYDSLFPHETSQVPMFMALGTPPEDKRHVIYDTGHSTYGYRNEATREILDWLDRYLGPVK